MLNSVVPTCWNVPASIAFGGFAVASIVNTSLSGSLIFTYSLKSVPYGSRHAEPSHLTIRPTGGCGTTTPFGRRTARGPGKLLPYLRRTASSETAVVWLPDANAAA